MVHIDCRNETYDSFNQSINAACWPLQLTFQRVDLILNGTNVCSLTLGLFFACPSWLHIYEPIDIL